MENGLAKLSLDDKEEEILQAHNESDTAKDIYDSNGKRRSYRDGMGFVAKSVVNESYHNRKTVNRPCFGVKLWGDLEYMRGNSYKIQDQMDIEHDLEDCPIKGGYEKKRSKRGNGNHGGSKMTNSLGVKDGRLSEQDYLFIDGCQGARQLVTMKILCWNIRGLGTPRAIIRLRHTLNVYNS
ncbi:hypothetical protein Goarm_023185 [Gossypium armourianum]|uniref:Uncharacterized protein n=1 Tax=Gossypium armourianum TaxID=34283 RepID=A0A7J9KIM5_9ROSI|nr:hypothetical protein [Gossypium armourianum]